MRAEEGDESLHDYVREARQTHDRVARPSWSSRLRRVLNAFRRRP